MVVHTTRLLILTDVAFSAIGDAKLAGPEAPVQTLERGTDPLHVEMRSHSVQTRLSSLPSPQTMSSTAGAANATQPSGPLILHRVIVDPSAEAAAEESGGSGSGLTAILPLLKQCTRCGSQRVRLLLVERPPPPPPQPPATPSSVTHTSRYHRQQQPHPHRPQRTTLPRMSQTVRKSSDQETSHHLQQQHHHQPSRQLRPTPTIRSLTQPVKFPSGLSEEKSQEAASTTMKPIERTRGAISRRHQAEPCTHHPHLHLHHDLHHYHTVPPPQQPHQRGHRRTSEATSSGSRGRSLPRDVTPHPLSRQVQHAHQYPHHPELIESLPQEPSSTSIAPSKTAAFHHHPTPPEAFHPTVLQQRPRRRGKQRVGQREQRLEDDGLATPSSMPLQGAVVCPPHSHPHRRHHLTPPAVEAQPAPPPLAPRLRRSLTTATTSAISLSQPLLTQTPTVGRPRRTYDEVDYLLYNLCLNIESAL
ncbi:hypothetical protein ECG_03883 [Echinococcus granulosus]|nr:hypothetical protein ECG_03882 [Echinococcus granulosus]KAH9283607.1 hypothetical protein ECG_03883 [Echinococcus granulosus]